MLKHDYARKKNVRHSRMKKKLKIIILLVIAFALLFFSLFLYEKGRPHPTILSNAYMQHWWQRSKITTTPPQTLAVNKIAPTDETPIHFEFYSSLPSMSHPEVALPAKLSIAAVPQTQNVKLVVYPLKNRIVNPDELAAAISHTEATYILQLGIFQYANSAERYRQSLNKEAIDAVVVKINFAKNTHYRVQLGPFANKDQVNLLQKKLQKKGIHSVLHTVTTS